MAHSKIPNAGQAYASARKHRTAEGKQLLELRNMAFVNRKRGDGSQAEDPATVQARIETANRAYQSSVSRYY